MTEHSQASEEAKTLAEVISTGMAIARVIPEDLRDNWTLRLVPIIEDSLNRVSRERTQQALERAAKAAEAYADTFANTGWEWDLVRMNIRGTANWIRGLSDGESVASEEK